MPDYEREREKKHPAGEQESEASATAGHGMMGATTGGEREQETTGTAGATGSSGSWERGDAGYTGGGQQVPGPGSTQGASEAGPGSGDERTEEHQELSGMSDRYGGESGMAAETADRVGERGTGAAAGDSDAGRSPGGIDGGDARGRVSHGGPEEKEGSYGDQG